ncbi:MAG: enoyl-ACP reductase [Bacteroidetes bacterium GWA2_30_7]|nr:MAG: enoyl-ACP reductase [Bacteroidetes bacterium GWA2_30_7]
MAYNLLKGKRGIIFGALDESSIAWKVAEKAHAEGAIFTLSNVPVSIRIGKTNELGTKLNSKVIAADATNIQDIENLYKESVNVLGGKIDFILHSIAMSLNVRKGRKYDDLDYEMMSKTLDISAISFHKILQIAKKMDVINEWGSVVALSYIGAQRTMNGYNEMSQAKAMLESIARSFGYFYGRDKKVRVNTVSQSPTFTKASSSVKGFDGMYNYSDKMAPLGNSSGEDCADYCITLFSDLTKKVTMQNLYVDGGFSTMGMSMELMDAYGISLDS